jgi:hypothetical protein
MLDYRGKDGKFLVPASCVTTSNHNSLSKSETGVIPGMRSWNKHLYLNELNVRKPLVESISQRSEELTLYNLVLNLTISNPSLKVVSLNTSPGWMVRFSLGGDDRGFLKEEVNLSASMSLLTYFLYLVLLWSCCSGIAVALIWVHFYLVGREPVVLYTFIIQASSSFFSTIGPRYFFCVVLSDGWTKYNVCWTWSVKHIFCLHIYSLWQILSRV